MATGREVIGRGMRSEIIAWGEGRVLKLYHQGRRAEAVLQEAANTRLAGQLGIPVPRVYGTVDVDGRHGIVLERLEGPSMDVMFFRRPLDAPRLATHLARLHAQMHRADASAIGDTLVSQLQRKIMGPASPLPADLRSATLTALERMPDGNSLCHGDLHPLNVILSVGRGPVIIDWDSPARGNPLADVARTYLILSAGPKHAPARIRPIVQLVSRAAGRAYIRTYRELAGDLVAAAGELRTWLWINAAARLVEGVSVEQDWLLDMVKRGAAADMPAAGGAGR